MGSAPSRKFQDDILVMVDISKSGGFAGTIIFGKITGACAALARNNFEYTIAIDDNCVECVEEQFIHHLELEDLPWVSSTCRDVAVWVETHGERLFLGELVRRNQDHMFEVVFHADGFVLKAVHPDHLSKPDDNTIKSHSPNSMPPDQLWLLDRKLKADIDTEWPIQQRIENMLAKLRAESRLAVHRRKATADPVLKGPFVGAGFHDSEGFAAHPSPLVDLVVDEFFGETWAKYAGKIKFADTYKIGPAYRMFSAWVETVDAKDPLYFMAALPVYAGLISLGNFPDDKYGYPEWVRVTDVCLIGIAFYVNGELFPGFEDPPLVKGGIDQYGHESCHFIPGCVATYLADCQWVGASFCLAPAAADKEIRDDIYGILSYHRLLRECYERYGETAITLEVNLVLSTNYLANARQVCAGAVKIELSEKALVLSDLRLRDIQENKLNSQGALNPRRQRKNLSEVTHEQRIDNQMKGKLIKERPLAVLSEQNSPDGSQISRKTPPQAGTGTAPKPPSEPRPINTDPGAGVGMAP